MLTPGPAAQCTRADIWGGVSRCCLCSHCGSFWKSYLAYGWQQPYRAFESRSTSQGPLHWAVSVYGRQVVVRGDHGKQEPRT